jgi:signal transduction histidine kinase/CheY-like chemotaxis protein
MLILGTGVLSLAILGRVLRTHISKPIGALMDATERVAGGDLSPGAEWDLPTGRRDELGSLARSFGEMIKRLRQAWCTLEERIAERTQQLESARTQAESANQAKSAFLAAMSHEIRTPMNAVLNMVDMALESARNVQQREYLKVAESSARHLLTIINDILDFSKIESGKLEIEDIAFSLHDLLEGVVDLFRAKVSESKVELVLDVPPSTPDGFRGDPTRLRQVLVNLIDNALKFTPKGQVVLTAGHGDGRVRLTVADSGIGIPMERQGSLFLPFSQLDASSMRRFGGTGLGLAISRRLAHLMGGDITVSSVAGEGSTFTVELPLQPDRAGDRVELRPPIVTAGRSVLLIEDNEISREVVHAMLESHGLACISFPAVEPALEWLKSPAAGDIGLALVDWKLAPDGQDGIAGIAALRQLRGCMHCFLLSAFADHGVQEKARAAGAVDVISKPISWAALHVALQVALEPGEKAKASPSESVAALPFAGTLALLAEDNPQNQLVAKVLLKKLGIAVEVAENGKIALEFAQADPAKYQVILMDVQMPEMDGLQATRCIRKLGEESPELGTIPIIAMSASAMKTDVDACIEAGMNGFIAKPIDKAVLFAVLTEALGPKTNA